MSCSDLVLLPAIVLVALPIGTAAQSHVWVVSSPNPTSAIQGAIDAASDGDTVLVKGSGSYAPILIQSKTLTVLADQGADVRVNVTVQDLTSSQRVDLRGLRFLPKVVGFVEAAPPLILLNNQGLVWVEDCEAAGGTALGRTLPGISVDLCADVFLMRTHSGGWTSYDFMGTGPQEGHGLSVRGGSRIVAHDCLFQGADGYSIDVYGSQVPGGAGVLSMSVGDRLFLGACQAIGGDGALYVDDPFGGPYYCSDGGPGLQSTGLTRVFDSNAQGGSAGFFGEVCAFDGPDQTGNVRALQGQELRFSVSAPVREGQPFQLDFTGPPNTPVWLLLGPRPANRFQATGPLVIEQPTASQRGVTDASGALHVTQTMPPMAPGIQFGRLFLQAFYLDARGRFVVGGASMFVALDASL